jgi:hypothetical protein
MSHVEQTLTKLGFTLKSRLVQDDFNGREGDSHWEVTVSRNGQSYTTKYSMGAAHRNYLGNPVRLDLLTCRRLTTQQFKQREQLKQSKPNEPVLADVLYCLVSDAQSVTYASGFEDWAADMGYDDDSRKAEAAYRACQDCYFALRQLCDLDEMSELFQDY